MRRSFHEIRERILQTILRRSFRTPRAIDLREPADTLVVAGAAQPVVRSRRGEAREGAGVTPSIVDSPFDAIRPRKAWFFLPVLLAVGGAGAAVWIVLAAWSGPGPQSIIVPGSAELDLGVGAHRIYYEYQSEIDGRRVNTGRVLPPLDITLTSAATGREVLLEEPRVRHSYESDFAARRAGYSILAFAITAPGGYVLDVSGDGERVVLSVRRTGRILSIVSAVTLMVVAFALAIGLAIAIDVRRGRARRRRAAMLDGTAPHQDGTGAL
jgi:hypothetical protein